MLELIVAFAALVAALGVLWKAPYIKRPVAWVCRRLIGDPITEWFRRILREEATQVIQTELKEPNGGYSLPDLADQITELRAYTHDNIHELREAMTAPFGKLELMWEQYAKDHGIEETEEPE